MGVYLDNAATSFPKPGSVYVAVRDYLENIGVSSGRGAYRQAVRADRIVYDTRLALAQLFSVSDPTRIVFTFNATDSLNLALLGLLNPGDHVLISSMEHNAVWRPLKFLENSRGVKISMIPHDNDGSMKVDEVEQLITRNTRAIVTTGASNVTGTVMPMGELGEIVRRHRDLLLVVDAAQTAGCYPIDVQAMNIDFLAFTGHKSLMGPQGTGGLFIREGLKLTPTRFGGTGSEAARDDQPLDLPDRFEAGTLNGPGIAGLGAGVRYVSDFGLENIRNHKCDLVDMLLSGLRAMKSIRIYGPDDARKNTGVVSFNVADTAAEEVACVLDQMYGIMTRSGLHCSPRSHELLGTEETGALRISFGLFNTVKHVH